MATKAKAKKFIQKAIKRPGALTTKAKAAGKTIQQYCAGKSLDPLTKKQCNFAINVLAKVQRKGKKKK